MSATKRMDFVGDVMTYIVLSVHQCDSSLSNTRDPPENEKWWYLTVKALAALLITIQVFYDVMSFVNSYRHSPGVCCLHLYGPWSRLVPPFFYSVDPEEAGIKLLSNAGKCLDTPCLWCVRLFVIYKMCWCISLQFFLWQDKKTFIYSDIKYMNYVSRKQPFV
jgi:hypothetical protein